MEILSIINLKGGVAKTISSINIAHILATEHNKKVLIIDNDKQGNTSKILNRYKSNIRGTSEILTTSYTQENILELIQNTDYENLDIITANMSLLNANLQTILDQTRPQHTRFKKALELIESKKEYDYCIIDNAPDINISTINALACSTIILIPVMIDDFALDGLKELEEQIETTKKELNEKIKYTGVFITNYDRRNVADIQGALFLENLNYNLFSTKIRHTLKMKASTFERKAILDYSNRCSASKDYKELVKEILNIQ